MRFYFRNEKPSLGKFICMPIVSCIPELFFAIILVLILSGCGHNIYLEREITGARLDIPIGDGTIGFAVGCDKSIKATVRGGTSFETSSSNGGGLFSGSGGQSKVTQFKSNIQLNEANLVNIMTSSNCPVEAKLVLASNLANSVSAPYFPGSILQTKESTIHVGQTAIMSNGVERIQSTDHQGVNLLVDRTAKVVGTNIVNHTSSTIGQVVHDSLNPLEGTVSEIRGTIAQVDTAVNNVNETVKTVQESIVKLILVIITGILLLGIVAWLFRSKKPTKQRKIVVDASPDSILDEATDEDLAKYEIVVTKDQLKKQKLGFWRSFAKNAMNVILTIARWVKLIPPGTRKKILDFLVDHWKSHQARKAAEKKTAEAEKK